MTNRGDVPCFPMFSLFFGQLLHTTLTNVAVVIISMSDLHQMSIDSLELQQKCLHTVTFSSDTLFKLTHSPSVSYLFYLPDLPTFALHALCFTCNLHFHTYSIYSLGTLIAALTRIFNWEHFTEWQKDRFVHNGHSCYVTFFANSSSFHMGLLLSASPA